MSGSIFVINPDGTPTKLGYVSTDGIQADREPLASPEATKLATHIIVNTTPLATNAAIQQAITDLAERLDKIAHASTRSIEDLAEALTKMGQPIAQASQSRGPQPRKQIPPRDLRPKRNAYQR